MNGLLGAFHSARGQILFYLRDDIALTATKFKRDNMYNQAMFPDGTIHAIDLPADIYKALMRRVSADGTVDADVGPVYGNYLMFSGYKIKVTKYEVTETTYKVRLA